MTAHDDGWKLDKHIPIALIVALFGQLAVAIWWAALIDARLSNVETIQRAMPNQSERIVRVEVGLEAIKERLGEIKTLLMARPRSLPP